MQTDDEIASIDGVPVMTEPIGFAAEEMVACSKCGKPNPPNRLNCLYCGTVLELPEAVAAGLQFRPAEIEDWEPGISIVSLDRIGPAELEAVGSTVCLDEELLSSLANADAPIPIIRVRSDEADEVMSRVSAAGAFSVFVDDRELQYQKPPTRLKGLRFGDQVVEFLLFNSDEVERISAADVSLIVSGAIFKSSSEATVKTKKKETKRVDEKFAASDHAAIDIYTSADRGGFRILPHGFDFSCLNDQKSLLAVENLATLKEMLRKSFRDAIFDDTYISKMPVLDRVWPRTIENTSKGMHRVGLKIARSVGESVSNEEQFTRYSRMRRELI
jgi:hypothetical protein